MQRTKQNNQSILDFVLQHCGTIESLFDFMELNGMSSMDFPDGAYLIPAPARARVISYYQSKGVVPASVSAAFSLAPDLYHPATTLYMHEIGIEDTEDVYYVSTEQEITGHEMWLAVDSFVLALVDAGHWERMKAIYPFIGGSAAAHSINLKSPAQYNTTWHGGIVHDATGVKFGGVNGYGDPGFINPTNFNSASDCHVSVYSRADFPYKYILGNGDPGSTSGGILAAMSSSVCYYAVNSDNYGGTPINHAKGLLTLTRPNSANQAFYKRAIDQNVNHMELRAVATVVPGKLYFGALNQNSGDVPGYYSEAHLSCVTIGDGLSEVQNQSLYEIIEAFQVALNRGGI